jgi:Rieske Fe-S protein
MLVGGAVGVGAAACKGGSSGLAASPRIVAAGNVRDLPLRTLRAVAGGSIAIGRDDAGVYAVTLVCTHQGCDIGLSGDVSFERGIFCGCHGAAFDREGAVVGGPARGPLDHLRVSIDATGEISVATGDKVEASERAAASGS